MCINDTPIPVTVKLTIDNMRNQIQYHFLEFNENLEEIVSEKLKLELDNFNFDLYIQKECEQVIKDELQIKIRNKVKEYLFNINTKIETAIDNAFMKVIHRNN